jgi:hypothetical protein
MRKMTEKPTRENRRPKWSLRNAAAMAPKKQPAVSGETTLEETWAFLALSNHCFPMAS